MLDQDKTKEQLIDELIKMRRKLAESEMSQTSKINMAQVEGNFTQSEQNYRVIFERSPVGIFNFDNNGIIIDCNQAFVDVCGSTKNKLIGLNLMIYLKNEEVIKAVKMALSGKTGEFLGEYTSVTGSKTAWLSITYAPLFNSNGSISGGMGIVQDITARKKAEKALSESEQTLNSILTACPVGIGFIAYNRTMLWANQAWLDLFGFEDKKQLMGQSAVG
ncbi:MAG: PAS domain-containing protein, partial [Desulfomonilaceae bacterium]